MPMQLCGLLLIALAALPIAGTADAASRREAGERAFWSGLVPVENGIPVIMKGYRPPKAVPETPSQRRSDRPVRIPRGSSTYIPPVNPSRDAASAPPAAALTQPATQPYRPPPIRSFGDRVTDCIHSYPLNRGIGNNPTDQQSYIRQCAN